MNDGVVTEWSQRLLEIIGFGLKRRQEKIELK